MRYNTDACVLLLLHTPQGAVQAGLIHLHRLDSPRLVRQRPQANRSGGLHAVRSNRRLMVVTMFSTSTRPTPVLPASLLALEVKQSRHHSEDAAIFPNCTVILQKKYMAGDGKDAKGREVMPVRGLQERERSHDAQRSGGREGQDMQSQRSRKLRV